MTDGLAGFGLAALAAALFAAGTSLASALAYPVLCRAWRGSHPAARARAALAAAAAPLAVPALGLALCFAPGVLGFAGLGADHCLRHPDHPHLCLVHATAPTSPAALLLAGAAAAGAGLGLARGSRRLVRAGRSARVLEGAALEDLAPGVRRVDSPRAFSLSVGLWRPRIYVSNALAEALGRESLEVVIEHERAHARRRDPLRQLAARMLSLPHLPRVRRRILFDLELASEQACDESAALLTRDRLRVAETILLAERLAAGGRRADAACAFGESAVAARVRALLAEPPAEPAAGLGWVGAATVIAAGLLWLAPPVHHATEHLLGEVLRLF